MKRSSIALFAVVLSVMSAGVGWGAAGKKAAKKDGKNDVVGTQWRYEATKGDKIDSGVFRVRDFVAYRGDEKVGEVKPQGNGATTIVFTGIPELNGTASLVKTGTTPAVYRGTLKKCDGSEWEMRVTVRDK